jgi:hypothetical protein
VGVTRSSSHTPGSANAFTIPDAEGPAGSADSSSTTRSAQGVQSRVAHKPGITTGSAAVSKDANAISANFE